MAKSYAEVMDLLNTLKPEYEERHLAHTRLRKFWHGRYWENTESDTSGIASIFRDLTSRQSDIGPDVKLVYNVLKDVCVKFQTYLSPLPQIRCYIDPPSSPTRRDQATTKERFLYGTWGANSMNQVLADQGWYLPLMGDAWLGIWPDMETNIPRVLLRSPENAYPIMSYDGHCEDACIFTWKVKASAAKRAFPNWSGNTQAQPARFAFGKRQTRSSDPDVTILEYTDKGEFQRWVEGELVTGVEHGFGFDLFEHVKFINVPDEPWGHGAVEQAVNLVEMGNAYLSLMMQSAIENVFPVMVLEDPMKAPETLERGAGAVIPINAGGKAYYLNPPSGALMAQGEWASRVEHMVKQDTSMPDVNFGQANNSVITGKAINELQGAGTGTLVEMVQGVSIGRALSSWNEKAIEIARKMFKEDTIRLYGNEAAGIADINPRSFAMSIKGKELVGSSRNEVVFMPYLDMQQKVVIGLQLAGAGLVSKKWQRDNAGIPDSEAMDEEIVSEAIQEAVLGLLVQQITDPNMAPAVEQQVESVIETGVPNGHMPHPLLSLTGPAAPGMPAMPPGMPPMPPGMSGPPAGPGAPPGGPGGGSTLPGGGEVSAPPIQLPPGSPPPNAGGPPISGSPAAPVGQGAGSGKLLLDQVVRQFQNLQGLHGQVFLVGEIVQTGSTSDTIDVDITDASDRDVISQGIQLPLQIKVIQGVPNEPYIEVTPGASTDLRGASPSPEEAGVA